jgi:hypothetical protein
MSHGAGPSGAKQRLMTELQSLSKEKWVRFDEASILCGHQCSWCY